jgi:hypothetical protein
MIAAVVFYRSLTTMTICQSHCNSVFDNGEQAVSTHYTLVFCKSPRTKRVCSQTSSYAACNTPLSMPSFQLIMKDSSVAFLTLCKYINISVQVAQKPCPSASSLVLPAVAPGLHAVLLGDHLHVQPVQARAHHVVRLHAPRLLALDRGAALLLADGALLGQKIARL